MKESLVISLLILLALKKKIVKLSRLCQNQVEYKISPKNKENNDNLLVAYYQKNKNIALKTKSRKNCLGMVLTPFRS